MRPTDPALRRQLAGARRPLTVVVASGLVTSLLVLAQAFALADVVVAAVRGDGLVRAVVVLGAVVAVRALTSAVSEVAAAHAAGLVGQSLRERLVRAVLAGRGPSTEGEAAALATRGVTAAEPYLTRYVPALVLAAVLPPLTVVALATQDLTSAVIVLATLPLVPVFGALVGLATRDRAESQWRAMASLSGHFLDIMRGLPTLVAFRRARAQSAVIGAVTHRYRRATLATLRIAFASSAVLELIATLSVALVAVVVGTRLAGGGLDLRTALVVLLLAPEAYWPLRRVGAEFHAAAEGIATFERLADLEAAEVEDEEPVHLPLAVRGLTVRYDDRVVPAVEDVDLVVPERGVTALVGPSGCGKSTVLAVLAGLVEPSSGTVLTGGVEGADVAGSLGGRAWQEQVAWLPQRPSFVAGTVAENLRLAAPDADDARLWEALRTVALADRVRVAGGLDATVAEDGLSLSAGERARLALARVVLADRPLVLLDEPAAHVDPATEAVLADVVRTLGRDRSVVVVAHRPALVDVADHVVRLPGRRVVTTPPSTAPSARAARADGGSSAGPRAGFVLATVLGVLASSCGVALTATAGWLIVKASEHPAVLTMLVAIVGVRAFGIGRPVFRYAERLRSHDAALRLLAERRVRVYDAVVPLTPGRLGRQRGDVLSGIVDDVDSLLDRELRVRLPLRVLAVVGLVATSVAALLLPVAGVAVGAALLAGVAAHLLVRWGCLAPERESVTARAELSAVVAQAAHLAPELRMWQADDVVLGPVARLARRLARASSRSAAWTAAARALVLLAGTAAVVAVAALGSRAVTEGTLSGPVLALLVLLPVALVDVVLPAVDAGALVGRVRSAAARLDELEHIAPAVTDPSDPVPANGSRRLEAVGLDLGWEGRTVLGGLDLRLEEGERVAVVGPSGCGKSTLAAALVRFVDPLRGTITLGDTPLVELALDDVRGDVGLVDDDPHVFSSTLAENVRLARPDADDTEVEAALRRARLGPWLDTLPEGLGTWVGDGHAAVSGGERARLGLARSLLLDQPVLVLDEPVAHLDRATAEQLSADLVDGADGRTLLWISHDDVGLERMDRVVRLG